MAKVFLYLGLLLATTLSTGQGSVFADGVLPDQLTHVCGLNDSSENTHSEDQEDPPLPISASTITSPPYWVTSSMAPDNSNTHYSLYSIRAPPSSIHFFFEKQPS